MITACTSNILNYHEFFCNFNEEGFYQPSHCSSRVFMAFAGDRDILRVVVFDNLKLPKRFQSLPNVKGLIHSCAHAGNVSA